MERISKENYYLDIAETVIGRATCLRRCYGAIIVKNDEIISTGYNGAPRGRKNCVDIGYCTREAMKVPRGQRYELCRSVHAEANAIISAARRDMVGGTLYLAGKDAATGEILSDATSCAMCRRMIINAGITRVVGLQEDDTVPEGHRIVEIDVTGHTLMNKIQQEYYDLLHSQQAEFEISKAYHGDDMTPKEIDDESNRLRRIETLINMRQLMVDNRADEVNQEEALALMRELRGDAE